VEGLSGRIHAVYRAPALEWRRGIIVTFNQPPDVEECQKRGIHGFFVQSKVTSEGLNDFASRVSSGSVVPLVDHTESLWNPESIWTKRPSGSAIGKTVFLLGFPNALTGKIRSQDQPKP
jgi:hypothetical protein